MSETLLTLAVLACPVGMGAMMWMMMRGGGKSDAKQPHSGNDAELSRLRAEVEQMKAERVGRG